MVNHKRAIKLIERAWKLRWKAPPRTRQMREIEREIERRSITFEEARKWGFRSNKKYEIIFSLRGMAFRFRIKDTWEELKRQLFPHGVLWGDRDFLLLTLRAHRYSKLRRFLGDFIPETITEHQRRLAREIERKAKKRLPVYSALLDYTLGKCPECGSNNIIYDRSIGEVVCGNCGLVIVSRPRK
ncbi:MAG TPA: hypothetical protein ENG21_03910 [Nitrososphaeria archaeon]|nr:hypothetical protein [Nitrososphaeria archaeon]